MQDGTVKEKDNLEIFRKQNGSHYTPQLLASFVAKQVVKAAKELTSIPFKILDPAVGDGELLIAILDELSRRIHKNAHVIGFDTNQDAINTAFNRINAAFPKTKIDLTCENFVDISQNFDLSNNLSLFVPEKFDLIIANPPYVRTQVLGATKAQQLATAFELSGRIDLYHVFIHGIAAALHSGGIAGIIVSNRFMTTKSGAEIRKFIRSHFEILHIWDLGDTRLFEAAVLPAVLLLKRKNTTDKQKAIPKFTSIYSTSETISKFYCDNIIEAIDKEGIVKVPNENYLVQQGKLHLDENGDGVWRIATNSSDKRLLTVQNNTFCTFGEVGKIRVGVKTTADKVFIRDDWNTLPTSEQPELLKPLITHHIACRYKSHPVIKQILYTHYIKDGKRAVIDLEKFPRSKKYLNTHKTTLEARKYISEGGRNWFEIWVPQNPSSWSKPKIVFRDIAATPTFWLDLNGSVVNGDCYWLTDDFKNDERLLWLCLAVGNSSFIEVFYDHLFNNKLYAGRRRFMTQYVERFPLPNPNSTIADKIIKKTKSLYNLIPSSSYEKFEKEIDSLVWESFGFITEKISR